MNEQAAHLVDRVLPQVPYRQWVLTLPGELARVVAFAAELSTAVFGVFADELSRWQRDRANDFGIADPQTGSLLEIQRFADGARSTTFPGPGLIDVRAGSGPTSFDYLSVGVTIAKAAGATVTLDRDLTFDVATTPQFSRFSNSSWTPKGVVVSSGKLLTGAFKVILNKASFALGTTAPGCVSTTAGPATLSGTYGCN